MLTFAPGYTISAHSPYLPLPPANLTCLHLCFPHTSSSWPLAQDRKPEKAIKETQDYHLFQLQYLEPCEGDDPEEKLK